MAPVPELPGPRVPELGFSVSHQKVELDIDLPNRSLRGRIEMTIRPHSKDLKSVRLNSRQCELTRLTVNGRPTSGASHEDPYKRKTLPWEAGAHQYHMLQQRIEGQLKNPPEEELIIILPRSLKIEELDPFSEEAQTILLSKSVSSSKGDGSANIPELLQNNRFVPIQVNIEYVVKNIRDGMQFIGWEDEDFRYPHAYTTNSLSPGTACCLFPCTDDLTSRSTWEISIKCQKTIGDALRNSKFESLVNGVNVVSNNENSSHNSYGATRKHGNFSEEDQALDLTVVCTGDTTDEIVDPLDSTKKTTSFICTTAISVQHLGFAIGPFEHVDLAEFRESDEDERLGQNAVPVHGFCLPGRIDDIKNTCLPMAKAVDFLTMNYGAYPFSDYKLCFVDDLSADIIDTGSLSICSNRLLFPEEIIEPLDRVTRQLVRALAAQWIGINIVPKDPSDSWVVVGIAFFITDIFMKKLTGNNEYRYSQKRAADRVVDLDVNRPSLYDLGALITLDASELEFMELKAPLVLFILDRRLTKAGGSSGLSRIISRIFLNAKVGDLPNGALDAPYFIKTCEKLGHLKLDNFYAQWVEGAGCPKFLVTQRFNKKKLVVEMLIQQKQSENVKDSNLESKTFMRDVKEDRNAVYAGPIQPAFTGPMTIRIHEADGTPYEHIVEIKEKTTTFDIPYNTKYKRLKRSRRQKERTAAATGMDSFGGGGDDVLLYSLGDILQTEEEVKEWGLDDWSKEEEEKMSQESYEWIRMDADFEWICKMTISMPAWMWVSQLQQDRDVVAQLASLQYMALVQPHRLVSTILIRTLMDQRYFHGIRTAATEILAKNAREETEWVGRVHLEKAFQEFFCYTDSPMTRSNDFSDRASYYIQCAIPKAVSKIRNASGHTPFEVRNFLYEKLKFNDNSTNEISDCYYLATLMQALTEALAAKRPISALDENESDRDDEAFHNACLDEIDRYRRIDEWIPSYHNILSTTALDCKKTLAKAGVLTARPADFLQYTPDETSEYLRLNAFENLAALGLIQQDAILRWFLFVLGTDPSPYIRDHMLRILGRTLGSIAIGEQHDAAKAQAAQQDGLVIEQEASTEARAADLARKQTVEGALSALRAEISNNPVLESGIWSAITSPAISLQQMGELLDICDILYTPETSIIVKLKYPRYWRCKKLGKGKLLFSRSSRVRTRRMPERRPPTSIIGNPSPNIKRENSNPNTAMAPPQAHAPLKIRMGGPKKPSMPSGPSTPAAVESVPPSPAAGSQSDAPKLTLKLKFKAVKSGTAGSPPP